MKPKSVSQQDGRNSNSEWISATASAWKKTIFLTSAAVFIWMISAFLRESRDQVKNLERKIHKHSAGFAKLAMIGSAFEQGLTDVEVSHHSFMMEANPPEAVEVVDVIQTPETCCSNAKQECKADSNQKAEDKRKAAASTEPEHPESQPEKTTTTATRKSATPSQPQKSRTIGQRHFGVGLKLSI